MDKLRKELLQGTLDLLILKVISTASLHGWDIAKRIAIVSQDRLSLKQRSLYPALHRLEGRGWIDAEWGLPEAGRSAKFRRLFRRGQQEAELNAELQFHLDELTAQYRAEGMSPWPGAPAESVSPD